MALVEKDLRFNQQIVSNDDFKKIVSCEEKGISRLEGFTCFSAKKGNLFLCNRPINEREEKYGTNIPKTSPEEVELMKSLSVKISNFPDLSEKKIFFLVSNKNSTFCDQEDKIMILGYYNQEGIFCFACQDELLLSSFPEYINKFGNAREIFLQEGCVVYPDLENGQPITVVSKESPYYLITEELNKAKKEIKQILSDKVPYLITDTQAFLWLYSGNQELAEKVLSNISNAHKRKELNRIKENFLFFNTFLSDEKIIGFGNRYKLLLCCHDSKDKNYEIVNKCWKIVFGNVREEIKSGFSPDIFFKITQSELFIIIARLCVKFNKHKQDLLFYDEVSGQYIQN